jgi:hypothetical protein
VTEAIDYLRPAKVGEITGWSLNTLACYRSRGEGPPYVKVRNRVLYPADELSRWISENDSSWVDFESQVRRLLE